MVFNTGIDIKNWRKKNNLTQEELASMIDFSKDRIAHVESQNEKISTRLNTALTRLDNRLNPPPSQLVTAWHNIEKFDSERNHFYGPELKVLEKELSTILNRIPNRNPEKASSYFKFLEYCFTYINSIENASTTSKEQVHKLTNELYRQALLHKIGTKQKQK